MASFIRNACVLLGRLYDALRRWVTKPPVLGTPEAVHSPITITNHTTYNIHNINTEVRAFPSVYKSMSAVPVLQLAGSSPRAQDREPLPPRQ
jgi:hypothetical protein